jgi:hypothetical protein
MHEEHLMCQRQEKTKNENFIFCTQIYKNNKQISYVTTCMQITLKKKLFGLIPYVSGGNCRFQGKNILSVALTNSMQVQE